MGHSGSMAALLQRLARIRDGRLRGFHYCGIGCTSPTIECRVGVHRPGSATKRTSGRVRHDLSLDPLPPSGRAESLLTTLRLEQGLTRGCPPHIVATLNQELSDTGETALGGQDPRDEARQLGLGQSPDEEI